MIEKENILFLYGVHTIELKKRNLRSIAYATELVITRIV